MKKISYAQNFEDIILLRAFGKQEKGFYIDIGSHHPIEDSVTYNFYKIGWRGINIDPDKSFNELYQDLRPYDLMLNITVSNNSKNDLDFYLVKGTGLSTFNVNNLNKNKFLIDKIQVTSKTLDEIILENNLKEKLIDLIKIDAEGSEKKIIEGWSLDIKCKCIVYEITNLNNIDNKFILEKLKSKGFDLVFQDGINNFLIHKNFEELKKFFKFPVNVNDDFITYIYQKNIQTKENEKNDLKRMYFGLVNILNLNIQNSVFRDFKIKIIYLNIKNNLKIIAVDYYKKLFNSLPKFLADKLKLIAGIIFPHKKFYMDINKEKIIESFSQNVKNNSKRILIDLSEILKKDLQTGIQRVSKKITINLLKKLNEIDDREKGFETGKYLNENNILIIGSRDHENFYRYLNYPTSKLINIIEKNMINQIINLNDDQLFPKCNFKEGDTFLGLDYCVKSVLKRSEYLEKLKNKNVKIYFFIYDLLPVNNPEWFFKRVKKFTKLWLERISDFDGVFCISKNTRDDYLKFLKKRNISVKYNFTTDVIPMGHDINNLQDEILTEENLLKKDTSIIDFLIVGTIEPRKAHLELLKVFELIWNIDKEIRLTYVGKMGWMAEDAIREFVNNINFKENFFYFSMVGDQELADMYKKTDVLIIPSYNEGFGLPIIEAMKYKKHILARNIPVFREILGEDGNFFPDTNKSEIFKYLIRWIKKFRNGDIKKVNLDSVKWEESTDKLLHLLKKNASN